MEIRSPDPSETNLARLFTVSVRTHTHTHTLSLSLLLHTLLPHLCSHGYTTDVKGVANVDSFAKAFFLFPNILF